MGSKMDLVMDRQENASSRTYVDLDQESNTHDNRLSPTIKCGIEGVTDDTIYMVSSGTSSSTT